MTGGIGRVVRRRVRNRNDSGRGGLTATGRRLLTLWGWVLGALACNDGDMLLPVKGRKGRAWPGLFGGKAWSGLREEGDKGWEEGVGPLCVTEI